MKKLCAYIFLVLLAFQLPAQDAKMKLIETIQPFPYQHHTEVVAALSTMKNWSARDWKLFYKMLDDDSLKLKATYALNSFVNMASLESKLKRQTQESLKKALSSSKSEYAKIFIQSQLNLLTDHTIVQQANNSLPKLPSYKVEPISKANDVQKLLDLEDRMMLAGNPIQKKNILSEVAHINGFSSFVFVSKFLADPSVNKDAASILARLALNDESIKGPVVREAIENALTLIKGEDSSILVNKLNKLLKKMPYDFGFVSLFNGKDLSGWKALVGNPISRAKLSDSALKAAQQIANEKTKGDWIVKDGLLIFTGHGDNLATEKQYADMEMYVDWKITEKGDAGIYLRGSPQVQIWDTSRRDAGAQVGSGGLYNNQQNESKPLVVADNKVGEWNRFHIIMRGEKVTVYLNGILVTDNIRLENYWDRKIPIFSKEQIELQAHGTYVAYRNIYLRELPSEEPSSISDTEKKQGFISLFDGLSLNQWTGNTTGYIVKDGVVEVNPEDGGGGNLYTKDEYADFEYRFEFQLTPGANNGIGIRAPLYGDAAYVGMEIQVLDSEHPMYKGLQPYQYHGSVYGVIPAKRGFLLPIGEWNKEEIVAKGNKIKVTLNGTVIVDADIMEASKNGTMDHKEHPGLLRANGHIGFLGHGDTVRFRNMRVRKLITP
ncbi:MAG: DUF1080 domain-containing protein [Chitinophagaceae bacterium]|nr:DUF1080 domain-containing protein [Chitinophagaceae bacterium]